MPTIAVVGLGYVGLSMAVLLGQHQRVVGIDLDPDRIELLRSGRSPIADPELEQYLEQHRVGERALDLTFTTDTAAYAGAEYVVVATPTNYDPETDAFDTTSVEQVVRDVVAANPDATLVVKSTVPVGFVEDVRARLGTDQVIFSPSSCGRAGPSRTTCTPRGSSSARSRTGPAASRTCWWPGRSSPTYRCC